MGSDRFEEIILVEGEKKALALSDAGKIAFGISGFYGGATRSEDGRWVPVPELEEIRRICPPEKIYLAGDRDTLFNGQFYDAAIKLREAFQSASIYCLQVPASAPGKGFDDCRAVMEPEAFSAMLQKAETKAHGVEVMDKSTVGSLALTSLRAEWPEMINAFKKGSAEEQTALRDNLVKLTVSLSIFRCDLATAAVYSIKRSIISSRCLVVIHSATSYKATESRSSGLSSRASGQSKPLRCSGSWFTGTGKGLQMSSEAKSVTLTDIGSLFIWTNRRTVGSSGRTAKGYRSR
jgi:hypothetical protein